MPNQSIPLANAIPGHKYKILSINAGLGLKTRLLQMGLVPGSEVTVLENNWGRILVEVRGSVIALSRGMAKKIIVVLQ